MKTLAQSLEYHNIMAKHSQQDASFHRHMANIYKRTMRSLPQWVLEHDQQAIARHK